ncbi:MAG: fumarylacetoacetate hydrolase family protein [Polyangiaceae bacterium]
MQRFVRVQHGERVAFAREQGDKLLLLSAAPWLGGTDTGESIPIASAVLLAPVAPGKILCVGRNYRAHAAELGNEVPKEPMLFYKPPSSVIPSGGTIELPSTTVSERVDEEAELGIVIGARLRRASLEDAAAGIFGCTIVCDVTCRDLQKKDNQWWRAKGMDTFCPVGPAVVTGLDASTLEVIGAINGETRQRGKTSDMVFPVAEVVRYVSQFVTLEPGDLISTGTPEGVATLNPGDRVEVTIEPIGTLVAHVARPA